MPSGAVSRLASSGTVLWRRPCGCPLTRDMLERLAAPRGPAGALFKVTRRDRLPGCPQE